ncbi:exodeoxyribonuclease V subunit alpha [Pigmentiphaga aceris]|uniref:RecBCD enzyme subunit RecD n=1 Tax=Pigmentiphaga aceris TaxID=1940612 RepID=A0A5C0AV68_9BURK|nr:exodeoxyribonuclease V subunit alpha [Pigmentiphaga aceris]QEI05504.1 exodeoxyribonuclease V subunit alpha [Pigmentiphaga aceris]
MDSDLNGAWEPDFESEPDFASESSLELADEPAWLTAFLDEGVTHTESAPAPAPAPGSAPVSAPGSAAASAPASTAKTAPAKPAVPSVRAHAPATAPNIEPLTGATRSLAQFAADRNDPVQPGGLRPLENADDLLRQLDLWVGRGWLRALDRAFVDLLHGIAPQSDSLVLLAAALTSHQLGHGHVCLDLAATLDEPDFALSLPPEGDALRNTMLPSQLLSGLTPDVWRDALLANPLVDHGSNLAAGDRPMVLAGNRLYLRRYWNYELSVAASLRDRLAEPLPVPPDLPARLADLFPEPPPQVDGKPVSDWQKVACALAARGRFSLITGGPGTGKTTTVVRLLGMLQASALADGQALRIRLAAPTGKAAARLGESIGVQLSRLPLTDDVKAHVPTTVSTLHRLLGNRPDSRRFRHDRRHPLSLDVLVIDEASMIDLEMMASVLDALPASARLILLGDKDQLASVEAGAVLGDLCRDAEIGAYRADTRAWLEAMTGAPLVDPMLEPGEQALAQQTVMLRHSRRFGGASGIGRLARAVNAQDPAQARVVFAQSPQDLSTLRVDGERDAALLTLIVGATSRRAAGAGRTGSAAAAASNDVPSDAANAGPQGYAHYLNRLHNGRPPATTHHDDPAWAKWAADVLAAFDDFRLLCALRKGPWGVEGLNQRVADTLQARGLIRATDIWYEGRPVLSTRNDYSLGLMNGDIGIAMQVPTAEGTMALRVAFPRNDGQGGVRFVLPSRIGAIETVFAMTVHKSQGSEFAHTALVLPPALNPVLTKELIYTGITRARQWFTLVESGEGVFDAAVARRVRRLSGLSLHLDAPSQAVGAG